MGMLAPIALILLFIVRRGDCWRAGDASVERLQTYLPDPLVDPFYTAPKDIASFPPGHVIRSREVTTLVTGRASRSQQVYYRTTDNQGDAVGTVATIWTPAAPLTPPKLLSYQAAENAVSLDCAPSWAWVNSSSPAALDYDLIDALIIRWALSQGYYVVTADFEGPSSAWLVGLMEGRAVLDGIRATLQQLCLPADSEVALTGYSGGAHATVWASSLVEAYAPDIKIIAAAFGGTPVDLLATWASTNGGPNAGLAGESLIGLANGYPKLNATLTSILTSKGKSVLELLRSPDYCIKDHLPAWAGFNFSTIFTTDLLREPVLLHILSEESLLSNVSSKPIPVPKFARFQWHGLADEIVPFAPELRYVEQQCAHGADITFVTLPGASHNDAAIIGLPGALEFIQEKLVGQVVGGGTCGSNITIPSLGDAAALALFDLDDIIVLSTALSYLG